MVAHRVIALFLECIDRFILTEIHSLSPYCQLYRSHCGFYATYYIITNYKFPFYYRFCTDIFEVTQEYQAAICMEFEVEQFLILSTPYNVHMYVSIPPYSLRYCFSQRERFSIEVNNRETIAATEANNDTYCL